MSVRDGGCEAKSFAVGAGAFEFVDCVGRTVRALKATGGAASVDGDSEDDSASTRQRTSLTGSSDGFCQKAVPKGRRRRSSTRPLMFFTISQQPVGQSVSQSGTYRSLFVLNRFTPGTASDSGCSLTERRIGGDHGGSHCGRSSLLEAGIPCIRGRATALGTLQTKNRNRCRYAAGRSVVRDEIGGC
jgi:hypothetical protein